MIFLIWTTVNEKIIILIAIASAIGIALSIIVFIPTQNEIEDNENSKFEETDEVGSMLNKINEDKIKNDELENPYYPKEREWNQSGPFLVDRSQYVLGEKIFLNIQNLDKNDIGHIIVAKIINSTHSQPYKKMQFDGSKPQQNFYVGIYPSIPKKFCTSDSLIGEWKVIFEGTEYESLKFKILDEIIPGMERNYQSVC